MRGFLGYTIGNLIANGASVVAAGFLAHIGWSLT